MDALVLVQSFLIVCTSCYNSWKHMRSKRWECKRTEKDLRKIVMVFFFVMKRSSGYEQQLAQLN